jgi:hypothetical protein
MSQAGRADLISVVAARVIDLRAEFEAQLRAVARLEDQLTKRETPNEHKWRRLEEALRRE